MSANPWTDRFRNLNREEIAARMTEIPEPYVPTSGTNVHIAVDELRSRLARLFLPNEQLLDIAEFVIGVAHAHSHIHYPSAKAFISGCYQKEVPLGKYTPAIGITGLAGIGKTALVDAIHRCFGEDLSTSLPDHEAITLQTAWALSMPKRMSPASVLTAYLDQAGARSVMDKTISLEARCRRQAYQTGVSLMTMDETQFASFSSRANAAVTSILITLCRLGIPNVFLHNFSLGHRLWERPQQDRQRLLSRHFTLLPDAADSADWRQFLEAIRDLAPGLFDINIDRDAELIHYRTAGIKRLAADLFLLAFDASWRRGEPVRVDAIEKAFQSPHYGANREDVQILYEQYQMNKQGRRKRPDLWHPYPVEATEFSKLVQSVLEMKEKERLEKLIEYSTTPEEKSVHNNIQKAAAASRGKRGANVSPIRAAKRDLDALKQADKEFRGE